MNKIEESDWVKAVEDADMSQDFLSQEEVDQLLRGVGSPVPIIRMLQDGSVLIHYDHRDEIIIYLQSVGFVEDKDFKLVNGLSRFECSDEVKTMLMLKFGGAEE